MKRTLLIALVMMVCACMALAQEVTPPGGPPPGGPGVSYNRIGQGGMMGGSPASALTPPTAGFMTRGATALSLDQDQTDKLTALLTKSDATLAPLRQKLSEACSALRTAVIGASYDAVKIKQLITDAQTAETALMNAELQTWVDLRAILTAEQIGKLQSAMGQRGGGGGGYRGNNGGGNNPPMGPPRAPGT